MNQLPMDILRDMVGFLDAADMTSLASVSSCFYRAVDHDKYWEREGKKMYPQAKSPYHDWRRLIRNRDSKNSNLIINSKIIYDENLARIYTSWQPLGDGSLNRVRMIIDPYGNSNINWLTEPCLSIYMESETPDITFNFEIRLMHSARKNRMWRSCHHFTSERNTWGVHQLISRAEIEVADSGFVTDGRIHLQLQAHVIRLRLRIMETSEMKTHVGRGLFNLDTKGHLREVMGGETISTLCQKHFPLQMGLVFWICDSREGEGIIPVRRIKKDEERRPMMEFLLNYANCQEEILLWADRFDGSDHLLFLKCYHPREQSLVVQGRMGHEEIYQKMTNDSILILEKTMEEVSTRTLATTAVVVLLARSDKEAVHRLYQDQRDRVFANLENILEDSIQHYRLLSMEKILIEGSKIYTDWRIINLLRRFPNKTMFLKALIRRPHIAYACDRCGKLNFTGVRHKCRECEDYDLCEDCISLPILPHRYFFRFNDNHQQLMIRSHSIEHQPEHTLRAIVL